MLTSANSALSRQASATGAPGFNPGALPRHLIPLRAAFGQDEVNYGTARYPVDGDGLVWVPREAVSALTAVGGFASVHSGESVTSVGPLKLHHRDALGCCYAGRQYLSDADGDVLVPAEAAAQLLAHGFVPVSGREPLQSGSARG